MKDGEETFLTENHIFIGERHLVQHYDIAVFRFPSWTRQSFKEFVREKHAFSMKIKLSVEEAYAILDRMEKALSYEKKIVEGYEKRIAELQAETDRLKDQVTK